MGECRDTCDVCGAPGLTFCRDVQEVESGPPCGPNQFGSRRFKPLGDARIGCARHPPIPSRTFDINGLDPAYPGDA